MKSTALPLILFFLILTSCNKDEIKIDSSNLLLGTWNVSGYEDNTTIYNRSNAFIDEPGFEFKNDGTLIERKNSGWCGTPPISYANYSGTWSVINDTLIQVEVGYWGGTSSYYLDIESVDSKYLKFTLLFDEKKDTQELICPSIQLPNSMHVKKI